MRYVSAAEADGGREGGREWKHGLRGGRGGRGKEKGRGVTEEKEEGESA